jgi:stearoyl-CoA desaturase (delta-9 desaturase)
MSEYLGAQTLSDLPLYIAVRSTRLRLQRIFFALSVIIPALGAVAAVIVSLRVGFSWIEPVTFLVMLVITGLGIEAGYHRLFSHGSWKTIPLIRVLLAIGGNMAVQGPILYWVAHHRLHHPNADTPLDPHSPLNHSSGGVAGFMHAHVGWFFSGNRASPGRFARDLLNDKTIMMVNRLNVLWLFLTLALPAAIGGIGTLSLQGALVGMLWGGFFRTFLGQHFTYFINSVCHVFGTKPYLSQDNAGNVWWLVIPTFGAGLHNNHHAFPGSASYSFRWWHLDLSGLFIRGLERVGLACDLKCPPEQLIKRKVI